MIISEEKKFIFIAVTKTGSSSIASALGKYGKIYGHKNKKETGIRRHIPLNNFVRNHNLLLKDQSEYFKFAFVRNPWERAVSWYTYTGRLDPKKDLVDSAGKMIKCRSSKGLSFSEFIKEKKFIWGSAIGGQLGMITNSDGKILADFIGRFENIQEDFDIVCDKIGIPREKLPHKNKSKHKHYTEYYDEETKEVVARRYVKDIEFFKYKFSQ